MMQLKHAAVLLGVPLLMAADVGTAHDVRCGRGTAPSGRQLQDWSRSYYPAFVAGAAAPATIVVGFLINERCEVVRHSAGFLPRNAYSEDIVLSLFPGESRKGRPAGIGDGVPPSTHIRADGIFEPRLVAAWLMKPGLRR